LMGHSSIKTTEIYLHVIESMSEKLVSPLDRLANFCDQELPTRNPDSNDQLRESKPTYRVSNKKSPTQTWQRNSSLDQIKETNSNYLIA